MHRNEKRKLKKPEEVDKMLQQGVISIHDFFIYDELQFFLSIGYKKKRILFKVRKTLHG